MKSEMKQHLSRIVLGLSIVFFTLVALFFYPRWEKGGTQAPISWDASGYYMYLPATFIYKDLKHCAFKDSILDKYGPTPDFQQAFIHEKSGNYVMKYAIGQSVLMSPFFFIGHAIASYSDAYPADGFSYPYQKSVGLGMLIYMLIGLVLLRKILREYYKDSTVALVLLAYVLGTNFLNYAAIDTTMTHGPLFTIYALIIYITIRFYKRPDRKKAIFIGLLTGLATLIRPTEIISVLIPLLWGVSSRNELRQRLLFVKANWAFFALAIVFFIIPESLQLIYWKYATGDWIVYSYQDQGFSWLKPHVGDYTFSYRSGWLRYCPMMILPFLGILLFIRRRKNVWAVLLFILLDFYIVTAWDVWDYGNTGGRAMVQCYPVIAFLFAALIEWVNSRKVAALIFYPVFLFCIYMNIWWTYQSHGGPIQVADIPREYYWATVGRWDVDVYTEQLKDNRFSFHGEPAAPVLIYENNLDKDTTAMTVVDTAGGQLAYVDAEQATVSYFFPRPDVIRKWVRATADITLLTREWDNWRIPQLRIQFINNEELVQESMIRTHRFLFYGEQKKLFVDSHPPQAAWNRICISLYNAGSDKKTLIDNIRVVTFDE
jgi:hypothetical protein